MLRAQDFTLNSVGVVAFTSDPAAFNASHTLAAILGRFADRYDGDVQALPLFPDAPPELPRLILQSQAGDWQFVASASRLNSTWKATGPGISNMEALVLSCLEPIEPVITGGWTPGRLALVINLRMNISNAAEIVVNRFCSAEWADGLFADSENFEIHNHKTYQLEEFPWRVNSWVRCKTVTLQIQPVRESAILIEEDINTLAEEVDVRRFTLDEARQFFRSATVDARRQLEAFFPNE